ncbi:MAG TPA: hypothetical protein VFF98_05655 [Novosphingobium sp.]|nr:hypothetical protein [Novosphingobium sp.]
MGDMQKGTTASVEPFPALAGSSVVTDELNSIWAMLKSACPAHAQISFLFDGQLHVHIDVQKREDVIAVKTVLATLGLGLFHTITSGGTPHHPFFHRISARVNR